MPYHEQSLVAAFRSSVTDVYVFTRGLLVTAASLAPWLVVLAVPVVGGRRLLRGRSLSVLGRRGTSESAIEDGDDGSSDPRRNQLPNRLMSRPTTTRSRNPTPGLLACALATSTCRQGAFHVDAGANARLAARPLGVARPPRRPDSLFTPLPESTLSPLLVFRILPTKRSRSADSPTKIPSEPRELPRAFPFKRFAEVCWCDLHFLSVLGGFFWSVGGRDLPDSQH